MCAVSNKAVSVITLGRMGFMAAYDVQMRFARQHLDELAGKPNVYGENTLLLVEHTPVYTVGIRNQNYSKIDEVKLKQTGAEFYKTNRGGLITFHGPGQLVAYPILNLQHFKPSMKWYVCQLEKTLITTLKQFGLTGQTTDQTGVWVEDRKIASIGLHGSRYVTTHGVSLNCNVDLDWFKHILRQEVDYDAAVKPFLRGFQEVFECELEFKMLDEKELRSVCASSSLSGATNCDSEVAPTKLSQRAE
ncbi:unnamed protein product [Candidula unifasciata]|uniref:lipoyl(octanoyl) transferase n=1 Tax=Candidula unifasciata TaxID=100452 RepID=A0A8S3ZKK2_9EUPU|nr:unnamed protein product [Candidula unifasciata]